MSFNEGNLHDKAERLEAIIEFIWPFARPFLPSDDRERVERELRELLDSKMKAR